MATSPVETIEQFFRERNRAWLTNDTAALQAFAQKRTARWLHYSNREFAAKQHEMHVRDKRLLRTHSQLDVNALVTEPDRSVRALVDETVHFVYRDGPDYYVEARKVRHQQRWLSVGNGYMLADDEVPSERRDDGHGKQRPTSGKPGTAEWMTPTQLEGDLAPYPSYLRKCNTYDRVRCQRYADLWWNSHNPKFIYFADDDCTGFVSQCLYAANVPMTDKSNRSVGWWYQEATKTKPANWSYSWSTSDALYLYVTGSFGGTAVSNPRDLRIGDLVFYDWDGDGRFNHTTVVTDFDSSGDPLVNAHTISSYHRHFQYLDSPALTADTRYAYVHMPRRVCD